MTVKTPAVVDNLDPVWNFEASLLGFQKGDSLKFKIWDSDSLKKDDFLGMATLSSDQFLGGGFYGQLPLVDKEGRSAKGSLTVKALVEAAPAQAEAAPAQAATEDQTDVAQPQRAEPEITEEMQKPTGWCC